MRENLKSVCFFGVLFLFFDQIIKIIISDKMVLNQEFVLINKLLSFNLVHNTGAAFSLFNGGRIFFIIIGILAIGVICFYVYKQKHMEDIEIFINSLLIGGVLGNLIDRIIHGYVIDYVKVYINGYTFPVFNMADICIVLAVVLMFAITIKGDLWKE